MNYNRTFTSLTAKTNRLVGRFLSLKVAWRKGKRMFRSTSGDLTRYESA